jgi:hypothetical protein
MDVIGEMFGGGEHPLEPLPAGAGAGSPDRYRRATCSVPSTVAQRQSDANFSKSVSCQIYHCGKIETLGANQKLLFRII